jgi:hypothetical protein
MRFLRMAELPPRVKIERSFAESRQKTKRWGFPTFCRQMHVHFVDDRGTTVRRPVGTEKKTDPASE